MVLQDANIRLDPSIMHFRSAFVVYLTGLCLLAQNVPPKANDASEIQHVLDEIKADSLRTDLSYIASDQLQGRDTPSPGLDLAADYIAAQFRRACL